jgi:chromosome segregation protein
VTLRGEVFMGSGPVLTAGTANGGPEQSVLSRQRRQRELSQDIHAAEAELRKAEQELGEIDTALTQLQSEGEARQQAQRQTRQAYEAAALAADQARLGLEQSRRQARWQQEQRENLQQEIQRGEQEAANIQKDLERSETEIHAGREQVRELSSKLAGLSLEEFQAEVNHWSTQSAVAERALSDARSRQRERQAALDRAGRARANMQLRLAEIEKSIHALEQGKIAQRAEEGQIATAIEALRVLIDPAEAELETQETQQQTQQTLEAAARQALSQAEHHHAQARINLARRQEGLESLRRRVEDDFGLVAFEYNDDISGPKPLPLDGMVEQLPRVHAIAPDLEEVIKRQRAQLRRMGAINPEAQAEYLEVKQRFAFLTEQVADLHKAEADVRSVIAELDVLMHREFLKTFEAVAEEFKGIFSRLFNGGSARLVLTDPTDLTNTGIDIEARLPGRRTQGLSLLSGGERSLTATALVFSLLKVSPTPFCVLDEVDAMLDEANVGRFRDLLHELSQRTQFVVVTHNRNTVQVADVIYGVTMGRDSASQVISLKLDEVAAVVDSP